jgi:hypothetical protein
MNSQQKVTIWKCMWRQTKLPLHRIHEMAHTYPVKGKGDKNTGVDRATSFNAQTSKMRFIAPSSCVWRQEELKIGLIKIWNYYSIKWIQNLRCQALNRTFSYKYQTSILWKSNILCHKAIFIHHHVLSQDRWGGGGGGGGGGWGGPCGGGGGGGGLAWALGWAGF